MITKEQKQQIIEAYATEPGDTGSTQVQVAVLTARIQNLSDHLQRNKGDHHGRRGLLTMVGKRKRLLSYLESKDYDAYKELIQRLELRR